MSAKGVEKLKVELCRLIKEAAQRGVITGDEPLIVLISLAAKMISEVDDEKVRIGLANASASILLETVEMYVNNDSILIIEEVLH